jgi:hypothetical protein
MARGLTLSILLRRFGVLAAFMFWQGGFTFYASVVVPVGQEVLGSHFEQGLITRQVTDWLNLAGAAALLVLAWDLSVSRAELRSWRWATWALVLILLGVLFWLHQHLDNLMDLDAHALRNPRLFRTGHRWYLWLSTIQWGLCVVLALLTLTAWRREDRAVGYEGEKV